MPQGPRVEKLPPAPLLTFVGPRLEVSWSPTYNSPKYLKVVSHTHKDKVYPYSGRYTFKRTQKAKFK